MSYGWVLQSQDQQLPTWLTDNLPGVCECGYEFENYYNDKGAITKRRCSNPTCFHKLALKIVGMCDILQVKGVGEATAEKIVINNGLTYHLEALPHVIREKLNVSLYTYLRIQFIEGVDTSWSEVTDSYETLDDIFEKYQGRYRAQLDANKDTLYRGLEYIDVRVPEKQQFKTLMTGTVMLSGNIRGFTNRNDFIAAINYKLGGLVDLRISEHKRKTGIMALIQEKDTPNRGKAECALENHIPIMTPTEFQRWLGEKLISEIKKLEEQGESVKL